MGTTNFCKIHQGKSLFLTAVENVLLIVRGGLIWGRGGNFSKIINRESQWGTSQRGTCSGCINDKMLFTVGEQLNFLLRYVMVTHLLFPKFCHDATSLTSFLLLPPKCVTELNDISLSTSFVYPSWNWLFSLEAFSLNVGKRKRCYTKTTKQKYNSNNNNSNNKIAHSRIATEEFFVENSWAVTCKNMSVGSFFNSQPYKTHWC